MKKLKKQKKVVRYLDVMRICPNPYQQRKNFDEISLKELAKSIEVYGVIEPICVRYIKGDRFELISGERRLRACKILNIRAIPAIIINMGCRESASISLIENMQRDSLNFIEEAEGFQTLMVSFGYTREDIAKTVGKRESIISNKLELLKLKKDIKRIIIENNLSESHAHLLLKLENEELQKEVLHKVIELELDAKNMDELIKETLENYSNVYKKTQKIKGYIGDIRIFTNTIKSAVDVMNSSGIGTDYLVEKKDGFYEIKIKVSM